MTLKSQDEEFPAKDKGDVSEASIRSMSLDEARQTIRELQKSREELRLQNQKLQKSESLFRLIATNTADIIFSQDDKLRYNRIINPASPLSADEVIEKTDWDLLPPGEAGRLTEIKQKVLETGGSVRQELLLSPGGVPRWYEAIFQATRDDSGRVVGIISYSRDITASKLVQEENLRIKSLLETAGRVARFGGWRVNLSDYKVYMSSQVAEIIEAPPDYSATVEEAIAFYTPEWREKISEVFNRCATNGVPYDEEMEIITLKGRRMWIRATGEAIRDEAGVIRQVAGAFQDITENKKIHEALLASLEEKEVLLREVHHRVKNNLAIITTLLQEELEEVKDSAAAAVLWDLENRIRSIALVHEHLYQNENLARIDFQDYLDSLLQDLRFSLGEGKNIRYIALAREITFGIDAAIPCGMIINELVTNAIKYAFPDGKTYDGQSGPEISVEVRKDNGHYHIVVADNGVGIPEEINLNNSQSFGLRLVRMIGSHQLGGKIELERAPGTRVTFTFKPRNKESS